MTKEELEYNRGYRYGYERGELNGYKLRKSEEKHYEDAVSRERVIKYIKEKCNPYGKPSIDFEAGEKAIEYFKSLPPVTPTQKKEQESPLDKHENDRTSVGHVIVSDLCRDTANLLEELETKTGYWFVDERPESNREIICSNCEQPIFKYHELGFDYRPKYCPNCGAKMI